MIRQNTAAIVVSDPAVLYTDLILLAVYPGIIMIITGDSNTNAIIAIITHGIALWWLCRRSAITRLMGFRTASVPARVARTA